MGLLKIIELDCGLMEDEQESCRDLGGGGISSNCRDVLVASCNGMAPSNTHGPAKDTEKYLVPAK